MSARSMLRPSVKNCQASSRLVDESTMPTASAERSRTHWKNSCTLSVCRRRGIRALVVLSVSHSSVETISRARRAFSRAAVSAYAMDRRIHPVDRELGEHVFAADDLDRRAAGASP